MKTPNHVGSRLAVGLLLITVTSPLRAQSPHLPSEEQLEKRLSGIEHSSDGRGYQAHSTESTMSKARRATAWVKEQLASLHVTPSRLAVGLGVIGVAVGWSRNKRMVKWAVISGLSWVLLAFGVAAMIFRWAYFN